MTGHGGRTRGWLTAAAALVLTAGCSGSGRSTAETGSYGAQLPSASTPGATAPGGAATPAPGESGETASPAGGGGGGGAVDQPAGPAVPGRPGASFPSSNVPPGAYAPVYLRSRPAQAVVVEITAQGDAALVLSTVNHVVGTLRDVTTKSVTVVGPAAFADSRRSWTGEAIRAAAAAHARVAQGSNQRAVLRLLVLHGSFAADDRVIGVAVRGDVVAVFADKIAQAATVVTGANRIEEAVVTHEVGHVLGLVDLYLDTGRDDPDHPGHSANPDSVMYWAVESDLVAELLGDGPPVDFDAADRADLATIRAG